MPVEYQHDQNPANKYRMTFRDKSGREESHYVSIAPDPDDADKVKERLIQTRSDLYKRGVTWDTMTVVKVGPQTPADLARVSAILSGEKQVVAPK